MNATLQMTTPSTTDGVSELRVPGAVWVSVATLGVFAVGMIGIGVTGPIELIAGGLLAGVVALGLPFRHRWAHAMALVASVLAPVLMLLLGSATEALIVAAVNALIAVPLILTTAWFWKRDRLPVWLA